MKAKIVLNVEDALHALRKDGFDLAVVALLVNEAGGHGESHSWLIVKNPIHADEIREDDGIEETTVPGVSDMATFHLKDCLTSCLVGDLSPDNPHSLYRMFPDLVIVDRGKYRYDDMRGGKIVAREYPFISWGGAPAGANEYVLNFSKRFRITFSYAKRAQTWIQFAENEKEITEAQGQKLREEIERLVEEEKLPKDLAEGEENE